MTLDSSAVKTAERSDEYSAMMCYVDFGKHQIEHVVLCSAVADELEEILRHFAPHDYGVEQIQELVRTLRGQNKEENHG